MTLLEQLHRAGALEPIDLQVGRLLERVALGPLGSARAALLGAAAARVSAERRRGSTCLPVAQLADLPPLDAEPVSGGTPREPLSAVPPAEDWRAVLDDARTAGLCSNGEGAAPLVLGEDCLYLHRFWAAERRLGHALRQLVVHPAGAVSAAGDALFRRLFPEGSGDVPDLQAAAARTALTRHFCVITGGPGTGKTTTVARIVALLLAEQPERRIALAAPTGKAAARLHEAVASEVGKLDLPAELRARIPSAGRTLHRLLGYRPHDDRFSHNPERPLTEDVVIVDEASMVDLLLMDALLAALRPGARLVLLGDHGQLASVEAGAVLGDYCRLAMHAPEPFGGTVVELRRSYRFEKRPGIGAVARAMREGDIAMALAALDDPLQTDVTLRAHPADPASALEPVATLIDNFLGADTPAPALAALGRFRILCATYGGPWGVEAMNALVEARLRARGWGQGGVHYDHQPILITANDHAVGLFNGDLGVILGEGADRRAWFPDGAGGARAFAPARLPAHRPAWAMTVHKSQGSEFDRVLLVLPERDTRVLGRELLYTAVTRAREAVDIVGTPDGLQTWLARPTVRRSGLASILGITPGDGGRTS